MGARAASEQMVCDAGAATAAGLGITTMVAVIGVFAQVPVGTMVNVTVTGAVVVLVRVPTILPLPLEPIPVTRPVLFLVQVYVLPSRVPVNMIGAIAVPEHNDCAAGVATAFNVGNISVVAGSAEQGAIESSLYTSR